MKNVFFIFLQEFRILIKDRQALALLFIMPLALITFLTLALQDVYQMKISQRFSLQVVSAEDCVDLCQQLMKEMRRFPYEIQFSKTLDLSGKPQVALVLPAKMETTVEHLKEGKRLEPTEQIQLLFDPVLDQSIRSLVQGHLFLSLQAVLIDQIQKSLSENGGSVPQVPNVARFEGLVTEKAFGGAVLPNPIQYTVPAWALFGMFFILIPMSNSMVRDRRMGVFKRLLSFPVSRTDLVLGKISPFFLINLLQFAIMFAFGLFILPKFTGLELNTDFSYVAVLVVTIACAMAATGYGLMISCLVRTSEQASAFGALSVIILAVLGGVMIPRFIMPAFMQKLGLISPLYWGLAAYQDILVRKLDLAMVADKIAVLVIFALFSVVVSVLRFRWNEV